MKVLKIKLDLTRVMMRRNFRHYIGFVLIIGLAVFFLFHNKVAYAEAVYSYTKTMGDTGQDYGQSVAVDSSGNVYITGSFQGTVDFNPGGTADSHTAVSDDIFLTKINSDGTYGYTKTMGGTGSDSGRSVVVDGSDNVYITGSFQQTVDFDPGAGTDNHTVVGQKDIFLTKFDSAGNYLFTKTMGGSGDDDGQSVAVDSSGNVYITGSFQGTVYFNGGVSDSHTAVLDDIFLTKFDSAGNYLFTKTMGGNSEDYGQAVAVDGSGNVYITGSFRGTANFNPGGTADNHTSAGEEDVFLTKINSDGSYGYTKIMGGTDHDYGRSVAVDGSDNVYITGYFSGTADFNPDAAVTENHTSAGEEDIFLTKIASDGSYGYTKTMGGTDHDYGRSVVVDISDNVYIAGSFSGTADFDPGSGTDNRTAVGQEDIFLTKINFDGSYDLTKSIGGSAQDVGRSVAVDNAVNVYITGSFQDTVDFNPGGVSDSHTAGNDDIFLTKFRLVDFIVVPTSVTATGDSGTATFTVKLLSEPSADVILPVISSNSNLGTVDKSSLTFTNADWFVDQTVTITNVTSSGLTYSILLGPATSTDADYNGLDAHDVTVTIAGNESGSSGSCFIATAAYGSPLAPYVKILSRFRDRFLLTNGMGRYFVHFYYTHSPPMANFIKKHDDLRAIVRFILIPLVGISWLALKVGLVTVIAAFFFFCIGLIGILRCVRFKHPS